MAGGLLKPDGRFGISDSAWSIHLLGLQGALPGSRFHALSERLPMLRAGRRETEVAAGLARLLRDFGRRLNNTDHRLQVLD